MPKFVRTVTIFMIIFVAILFFRTALNMNSSAATQAKYNYSDFKSDLYAGKVAAVEIQKDSETPNAGVVYVTLKNSADMRARAVECVDIDGLSQLVDEAMARDPSLVVNHILPSKTNFLLSLLLPIGIAVISVFILFFLIQNMQGGGGGGRMGNFTKSRAKLNSSEQKKVTFADVASLEEEKEDLKEIVEFLKEPKKFTEIGARIPKGVLLLGRPGTGKTYLSRAVAGEAGVPFFSISGSDFVEMYVGVGASRVRDLFDQAKRSAPCIVFIDEIDAVGRRRGAGLGGGHDEREQTLNQLLVEMDGFAINQGVIVLAATNRPDILDPALLRPGRFDRQISVGAPDVKGREAVLTVHANGKKLGKDVDLKVVAQTTSGFTPSDLENLLNEAALLAAREGKVQIDAADIRRAFVKVGVGAEKKSRIVSEKDKRITAYHEAGHAILFEVLSELDPVHIVSIIPTGRAAGYTMPLPPDDSAHMTKRRMEQDIIAYLGGRAAEFVVLDDITTGASNDIEQATKIARAMVTKYGMSGKLGLIAFGDDNEEVFIGRDLAHTRNYSESTAAAIDSEIKRVVDEAYNTALEKLRENIDVLHKTAALLVEKEKITGDEFRALFNEGVIAPDIMEGRVMI